MHINSFGHLIERALTFLGLTSAPPVSPPGSGTIYFDSVAGKFKVSQNGAAYIDLVFSGTVVDSVTLTAGETLSTGELVYISGVNTVKKAFADTLVHAEVIGAASSGVLIGNPGQFDTRYGKKMRVQLETGLTVTEGQKIFLSETTIGAGTNIAPVTPNYTFKPLGFVVDASMYVGLVPANSAVDIIFQPDTGATI